jgi:uncharacterized protein DUF6714
MSNLEDVKQQIRAAFHGVEPPPHWCLSNGREGEEPPAVDRDFKDKVPWESLDVAFLDRAPEGWGTALSFFSDEAFHYYLPAYLLADLDDKLQQADPIFHLTHGLEKQSADTQINPRRYGARTWRSHAEWKFAMFDRDECAAIAAYLQHRREHGDLTVIQTSAIDEALASYWLKRAYG